MAEEVPTISRKKKVYVRRSAICRYVRAIVTWAILPAAGIGVGAGWWFYLGNRETIERQEYSDPYAYMTPRGSTDMTYTRRLDDGSTITISNSPARFLANVECGGRDSRRLFPDFRSAIDWARGEGHDVLPSVSLIHHHFRRENEALLESLASVAAGKDEAAPVEQLSSLLDDASTDVAAWIAEARSLRHSPDPSPDSSWRHREFLSLTPMIRPDSSFCLASGKVRAAPAYGRFQDDTFRAVMGGGRDMRVLRVQPHMLHIAMRGESDRDLAPHFTVEPAPAVYYRLSKAYGWLAKKVTRDDWGAVEVDGRPLHARLAELRDRALAISALSFLEVGLPPDGYIDDPLPEGFPQSLLGDGLAAVEAIMASDAIDDDPRKVVDLGRDRRLATTGVRLQRLAFDFEERPKVEEFEPGRGRVVYWAPQLAFAEVTRKLPDKPFAEVCDRYGTAGAGQRALGHSEPSGDGRVETTTVLWLLTIAVTLALAKALRTWRLHGFLGPREVLRRRMTPWRFRILSLSAIAAMTFAGFFYLTFSNFGFGLLALHVAPRFTLLPQRTTASFSAYYLQEVSGAYSLYDKRPAWPKPCADFFLTAAIHSNNPAVRNNALNMWQAFDAIGPRAQRAYYELAIGGSPSESQLAILCLCAGNSEEAVAYVLDVIERSGRKPEVVFATCWLFSVFAPPEYVEILEGALRADPRSPDSWSAYVEYMDLLPARASYDILVDLGVVPSPETPLEGELPPGPAMRGLENGVNQRAVPDDPETTGPFDLDVRPIELIVRTLRAEPDHRAYYPIANPRSHSWSPTRQRRFIDLVVPWIIEGAGGDELTHHRRAIIGQLNSWAISAKDRQHMRNALETLAACKPLAEMANPNYAYVVERLKEDPDYTSDTPPTYGGIIANALAKMDKRDAQEIRALERRNREDDEEGWDEDP